MAVEEHEKGSDADRIQFLTTQKIQQSSWMDTVCNSCNRRCCNPCTAQSTSNCAQLMIANCAICNHPSSGHYQAAHQG